MLQTLPASTDANLLVGFETSDDAAVYRLNDEVAMVMTADFITPPVDDPFVFGQIAAANALSDVFAMGARPVTCLSLVGFPSDKLDAEVLHRMVAGAVERITAAGAVLGGGHTTEDDEPKMGLSVTGLVHPDKIWRNVGALPGDDLILTKPIGSGVLFNANVRKLVPDSAMAECVATLIELNRAAAETLSRFEVHAATDVTGFGLAGHGFEVASGSDVTLAIEVDQVPILRSALDMYERGVTTGVNEVNGERVWAHVRFERELPAWHREIFVDPQTSGGLLVALPSSVSDQALVALHEAGVTAARRIGRVCEPDDRHRLVFE